MVTRYLHPLQNCGKDGPIISKATQKQVKSEAETRSATTETVLCHCIRCGRVIPSTHEYVYCGRCMDSWQRYSNMRCVEQEGHCYICGKRCKAGAERPACIDCYASDAEFVKSKCEAMRKT